MRNNKRRLLALLGLLVVLVFALGTTGLAAGDPTEEPGSKMIVCADCGGAVRIPAGCADDIDDICCKTNIVIRGKQDT